jgi:hypothetical protein
VQADDLRLPHFIIIGAMKAATSTLQRQLVAQPGIFMTDPKEPNFFSDDQEFEKGIEWYSHSYAGSKEGDIRGEASTHYTKLPTYPRTVTRLETHVPNPVFIYLMRHPVDRLVSHYIHEWSTGRFQCDIATAVERHSELIDYGLYAMQLQAYHQVFGQHSVLPVFFDRLLVRPQEELEKVCRFIGYHGQPQWVAALAIDNVSSERIRRFAGYQVLIESPVLTWVRRRMIPPRLRAAVKSRLQMQKRPELPASTSKELERIFDADLARLGRAIGHHLSCNNFRQVTGSLELDWVSSLD